MSEFLKKVIPLSAELKDWIGNTFASKIHSHQDIESRLNTLENNASFDALPDWGRAIMLERNGSYSDTYGVNEPIFKINVPGYIANVNTYGQYDAGHDDRVWKIASHPKFLYRTSSYTWSNQTHPGYELYRMNYAGAVDGSYVDFHSDLINPGTSTYIRGYDGSTSNYERFYFIPCKGVTCPSSYFVTKIGYGASSLYRGAQEGYIGQSDAAANSSILAAFAGNWKDNFNNSNQLITVNIPYFYKTLQGTGGTRWNNTFTLISNAVTGQDRVWGYIGEDYKISYHYGRWCLCHHYTGWYNANAIVEGNNWYNEHVYIRSIRTGLQDPPLRASDWEKVAEPAANTIPSFIMT